MSSVELVKELMCIHVFTDTSLGLEQLANTLGTISIALSFESSYCAEERRKITVMWPAPATIEMCCIRPPTSFLKSHKRERERERGLREG